MKTQEFGFGQRLRQRREVLGIRKHELAARIGVSLTTIQQYENGQMPKGEFAVRLCETLQCSLDWLLAGRLETQAHAENPADRLVLVPTVEARLCKGNFELSVAAMSHYAFRYDFLVHKGDPSSMVILRVAGDSMHPYIMNSDVALIDQKQTNPLPGLIYAVVIEDMVYLKIVNAEPGKLLLASANPNFALIEIVGSELGNSVRILGRAIWIGRELH